MDNETITIKCETEGFDEATEKVQAFSDAVSAFPPQVQIRGCRNCTITIYPSQTVVNESYKEATNELED